ncbi:MAG: hypothetical protein AAFV87_15430, partial [Pseudomonadota bacterium]
AQGQWLRAFVALLLWLPAVGFNGYSSYRYFVIEGSEVAAEQVQSTTELAQARTRDAELTIDIDAIGPTRAPAAIQAEIDGLPENYITARRELTAELAESERRAGLVAQREIARAVILAGAGAETAPDEAALTDAWILGALVIWMEAIKALALWIIFGRVQPRQSVQDEREGETAPEAPQMPVAVITEAPAPELGDGEQVIVGYDGKPRIMRVV